MFSLLVGGSHLDSCQTPISQLGAVISVYPDVTPDIGAHFLELWHQSCCDIGVFPISDTMISGTMISEYHWYLRYCDIGVSLISHYIWYQSWPAVISGYTDITAHRYHSCELWYRSYSDFWVPDIVPDITVLELWYRDIYWHWDRRRRCCTAAGIPVVLQFKRSAIMKHP